jgi:hypothetical protein
MKSIVLKRKGKYANEKEGDGYVTVFSLSSTDDYSTDINNYKLVCEEVPPRKINEEDF